ncbi:MAG: dipicolinate synthase subunit B [Ruminococcaceae bacterium]|nr:dipicolinate synthase subunit B [Oscillospiraceae bacterium]
MDKIRMGFALTGSFCTLETVLEEMSQLCPDKYEITPILSPVVRDTSTRFLDKEELLSRLAMITPIKPITTIDGAEPIGPKKLFDVMVVAPCTGNTLSKLALGITDTSVTMAVKASLRNEIPVVIAPSTNDALGATAKNIGLLLNTKNIYFVPFAQDMPQKKHTSMVADFSLIEDTVEEAMKGIQIQPVILGMGKHISDHKKND